MVQALLHDDLQKLQPSGEVHGPQPGELCLECIELCSERVSLTDPLNSGVSTYRVSFVLDQSVFY